MANEFIKPEVVIGQLLGVLARETILAQLVWRDPIPTFKGAKNDTVSIRLPAYVNARTRVMRSGTQLVIDSLDETKVDVTLDTHVYKAIGVSDEEMTLDVVDFGQQITAPAMGGVVRQIEDTLAADMTDATYETTVAVDATDPYKALVAARIALNKANVPPSQRFCGVGTDIEAAFLDSDRLSKYDQIGPTVNDALREAIIGRVAGFTVVPVPGLDPDVAICGHMTAFALCLVAPDLPQGADWGAKQSYKGMSLRALQDYDPTPATGGGPADRLLVDTFMGVGVTKDRGTLDGNGRFVPSLDGSDDPMLVRAVKLTLGGS